MVPFLFIKAWWMEMDLRRFAGTAPQDEKLSCRILNVEPEAALRAFNARTGVGEDYFDHTLARGDLGVGCYAGDQLIGWLWVMRDGRQSVRMYRHPFAVPLAPAQAYIHHLFVLPEFRDWNVWFLMTRWTYAALADQGFTTAVALIETSNARSLRVHRHRGWKIRGMRYLLGLFERRGWMFDDQRIQRGWIGALWRLLTFSRTALEVWLHNNALSRWSRALFPRAWLYRGPARGQAEPLSVLLLGDPVRFRYFAHRMFQETPTPQPLGRIWLLRWRSLWRRRRASMLYAETPAPLARLLSRRFGYALPEMAKATAPRISADWGNFYLKRSTIQRARRLAQEKGWTFTLSRDPLDLERFYQDYYVPYVQERFQSLGYALPWSHIQALFWKGRLLHVWEGQRLLGSVLCVDQPQGIWLSYLGIWRGSTALAAQGVTLALNYFAFELAATEGKRVLDFGPCHPFLDDGIFEHKRGWGIQVEWDPEAVCYWFVPEERHPAVQEFLSRSPFMASTPQGMTAIGYYDPAQISWQAVRTAFDKKFAARGLREIRLLPLPEASKTVQEAPGPGAPVSVWPRMTRELMRWEGKARARPAIPPMSRRDLKRWQEERLTKLLVHARQTVPHFQSGLADFSPSAFSWAWFRGLPLMKRDQVACEPERFWSQARFPVVAHVHTSGTTGEPMTLRVGKETIRRREAAQRRGRAWWGLERGDRFAKLFGRMEPVGGRRRHWDRWMENLVLFDAYHLTEAESRRLYQALTTTAYAYVYGFSSAVYEFARDWWEQGRSIPPGWLKGVILTAEMTSGREKQLIEKVFGAPAIREYGSTEFHVIAMECPQGGWHLEADRLVVEFLDEAGQSVKPYQTGRVVVTDLENLAMPLIRYPLGDLASFSDRLCACGRSLPLLHELVGRDATYIELPRGGRATGIAVTSVLESAYARWGRPLLPWQAVQRSREAIEVALTEREPAPALEEHIRQEMALLDPGLNVHFRYAVSLPGGINGKRHRVISEVGRQESHAAPGLAQR